MLNQKDYKNYFNKSEWSNTFAENYDQTVNEVGSNYDEFDCTVTSQYSSRRDMIL